MVRGGDFAQRSASTARLVMHKTSPAVAKLQSYGAVPSHHTLPASSQRPTKQAAMIKVKAMATKEADEHADRAEFEGDVADAEAEAQARAGLKRKCPMCRKEAKGKLSSIRDLTGQCCVCFEDIHKFHVFPCGHWVCPICLPRIGV